jgi:hypothetical protein
MNKISFSRSLRLLTASLLALIVFSVSFLANPATVSAQSKAELCRGASLGFDANKNTDCNEGGPQGSIDKLIANIVNILSVIVGIVAVVMIIIGGFRYITSGGDSGSVSSAKNTVLYAIVGLIIVALAQVIVRFVLSKSTGLSES